MFPAFQSLIPNSTEMRPREGKLRHRGTEVANSAMVAGADEDGCWTTATDETGTEPPGSIQSPPPGARAPPEPVADVSTYIRRSRERRSSFGQATDLCIRGWKKDTLKQYGTYLKKWEFFCTEKHYNFHEPSEPEIIDFPTKLYRSNLGFSSINTARAALAAIRVKEDDVIIGELPAVERCVRRVFNERASLPMYRKIWVVKMLLNGFRKTEPDALNLREIGQKWAIMIMVFSGQRLRTITDLQIPDIMMKDDKVYIVLSKLKNQ